MISGIDPHIQFNQSHTQALQTQIQATQILLDKQGTILSTLAPLLPLLQAVPLHVDALKVHIQESLLLTHKPTSSNLPSGSRGSHSPAHDSTSGGKRKQSDTATGAVLGAPLKRRRTGNSPPPVQLAKDHEQNAESPLASREANRLNADACTDPAQLSTSPRDISPGSTASRQRNVTPRTQQQHAATTPRRPLMDLLLPLPTVTRQGTPSRSTVTPCRPSQGAGVQGVVVVSTDASARASPTEPTSSGVGAQAAARAPMSPIDGVGTTSSTSAANPIALAPQGARPPRILRVQASFAKGVKKKGRQTGVSGSSNVAAIIGAGAGVETGVATAGPAIVSQSAPGPQVLAQRREEEMEQKRVPDYEPDAVRGKPPAFKLPTPKFGQQPPVSSFSSSKIHTPIVAPAPAVNPPLGKSAARSVSTSFGQNQIKKAPLQSVLDKVRQTPVVSFVCISLYVIRLSIVDDIRSEETREAVYCPR